MSGYELRNEIAGSIGHFWQESFGQLYPTLRELSTEGLVEPIQTDERRIPYRITPAGRAALREWLATVPETISADRNELLLRLTFGRHAEPGVIRGHLERHRAMLQTARDRYRELETTLLTQHGDDVAYWLASLRYGLTSVEAVLSWTDSTLAELPERSAVPEEDPR